MNKLFALALLALATLTGCAAGVIDSTPEPSPTTTSSAPVTTTVGNPPPPAACTPCADAWQGDSAWPLCSGAVPLVSDVDACAASSCAGICDGESFPFSGDCLACVSDHCADEIDACTGGAS